MLVYWLDIVEHGCILLSLACCWPKITYGPRSASPVLGVVTAVGGRTIRDMALDNGDILG